MYSAKQLYTTFLPCVDAYPDLKIHAMFYEYVVKFTGIWTANEGLESYDLNRDHFDDLN
jgi:hypothetical protein